MLTRHRSFPNIYSSIARKNLTCRTLDQVSCVETVSDAWMVEEVYNPELHQHISNMIIARGLGLDVGIKVP